MNAKFELAYCEFESQTDFLENGKYIFRRVELLLLKSTKPGPSMSLDRKLVLTALSQKKGEQVQ